MVERSREILAQLSPSDLIGPQKIQLLSMPIGGEIMLGVVLGQARGLSFRHNPQDESKPSIALTGPFKFIPYDPARSELRALRCFLPTTIHETIVLALQGDKPSPMKKSPKRGEGVDMALGEVCELAIEIGARHTDGGGVGYEYITREVPGHQIQLADPLAALEKSLAPRLLAGPSATSAGIGVAQESENPAPAKAKSKARKK